MEKLLAELIIKSANTREGSYVVTERTLIEGIYQATGGHYELSMEEACKSACVDHPALAEVVRLLLEESWNQALDWAQEQGVLDLSKTA